MTKGVGESLLLLTLRVAHLLGFLKRGLQDLARLVGEVFHVCEFDVSLCVLWCVCMYRSRCKGADSI
jgi:hypothetical protein